MKKLILSTFIILVVVIDITVFASYNNKNYIEVSYTVNDIIVNGVSSEVGSSAFISNGITYVPLRTVAELLGVEVYWDSSTKNIIINSSVLSEEQLDSLTDLEDTSSATHQTTTTISSVVVTVDEAKQQALSLVGGGTIIKFKEGLYYKDGPIRKYIIEVLFNGIIYEILIDPYTGDIIKFETKSVYN